MLDAQGMPLGRVISWLDQRGAPFDEALDAELGQPWFAQRLGRGRAGLAIGQLLRLRQVSIQQQGAFLEIMIVPVADSAAARPALAPENGSSEHVPT